MPATALAYVGMTWLLFSFPYRRLRVFARNDGKGVRVVLRDWERQNPTGLGARATADMAEERPPSAVGR